MATNNGRVHQMTKLMEYLLEPQTAVFFDIDGVLEV